MPYYRSRWSRRGGRSGHLRRMYGYFYCDACEKNWESAHVYCRSGTSTAEYGQQCKDCMASCMPTRVEPLVCSVCHTIPCKCEERHNDETKNHRSDLCLKCQSGKRCV